MPNVQAHPADEVHPQPGALKRTAILLYGTAVYLFFFSTFVYFIGFVGNFFVPISVDVGPSVPLTQALAINVLLVALFAVQHTIMARTGFKLWVTKIIPQPAERSTFVLFATSVLALLMVLWKPIPTVLWDVSGSTWGSVLIGTFLLGWVILFWSTFLINHFDLFGLRQVVICFQQKNYEPVKFDTPVLYRYVRHPMYVGLFIALWATPTMTVGHLVLAGSMTFYTLIGIHFEERSLSRLLGEDYREYQRQVSMIIPRMPKK